MGSNAVMDLRKMLPIGAIIQLTRENGLWTVAVHFTSSNRDNAFVYAGATTVKEALDQFVTLLASYEKELYTAFIDELSNNPDRASA